MTRWENNKPLFTADSISNWIKENIQNLDGIPISVKPTNDYTQVELLDIGRELSDHEKAVIEKQFPELVGNQVS
jgi:hypothetical protein